ncbi:MAG: hypothetical protein IKH11_08365 [Bacteroidales bacterium]|nr:hypothetical protein [Bacteroidales bacterium]
MGYKNRTLNCFLILLSGLFACACFNQSEPTENPLLTDLMSRLDSVDIYISRYEAKLSDTRKKIEKIPSDSKEKIDAYISFAVDYMNFESDSCIVYLDKALELAEKSGDKDLQDKINLMKSTTLINNGLFFEGSRIINTIKRDSLSSDNVLRYYQALRTLYHDSYQVLDSKPALRKEFVSIYVNYRDTLLSLLPENSHTALREKERRYAREGAFEQALAINQERLDTAIATRNERLALVYYDRFIIYTYYMKRPIEENVDYLLKSAILDLTSANQNIASLRYVENYLTSLGRLDDAKRVSDYYYSTMIRLGSRYRLLNGVEASIRINENYAAMLARQKRRVQIGLILIVFMSLLLLFITVIVVRSRDKIVLLNDKLARSGKTANRYVLGFFELYSTYIARLMALRAKINTNTRKGNTKYVLDLTDPSKDITNEELKQMYHNFDSAFLDIFPNFVQDFNSMLRPECQITLKSGELLNTELRIFAIIKLGITDSSKISELLHCSIKTVYNKRSELNSKLLIPKDQFAGKLAEI